MRGLICDDHPLMREAVTFALRDRWPALYLAEASDYPEAWAAADAGLDLCVIDLAMPGADPLSGLAEIRRRAPAASLIVLTGLNDQALLADVEAMGVPVLPKTLDGPDLLDAIATLSPTLDAERPTALPPRQQQVLALLAEGLTNKEIARRLGISPSTVKIHVARLTTWLGAANRTDAAARARRARLV